MNRASRFVSWGMCVRGLTWLTVLGVGAGTTLRAAEVGISAKSLADEQVRRVLRAETAGDLTPREKALEAALTDAPNHAPARWQSGQVKWKGQWLKFDEVAKLPEFQATLKQYDAARAKAAITVAAQSELADWCRAHDLDSQEKVHLNKVVELDPANSGARTRLGFVNLAGNWYSRQELADAEKRTQETNKALTRWTPQIKQILAGLNRPGSRDQAAAAQKLSSIKDPAALPAIEAVFHSASEKAKLKAVDAIAQMKSPEAALSLAKFAVNNPFDEVGIAAAEALRERSEDSYIPALLAILSTPIETRFGMVQSGNRLVYMQMFFRETDERRELFGLQHTVSVRGDNAELQAQALRLQSAGVQAASADQNLKLAERNAEIEKLNKRVTDVLNIATGESLSPDAQVWWKWWNDRNEVFLPNGKPLQTGFQVTSNQVDLPSVQAAPVGIGSGGGSGQRCECLVAGTPIWTASGPIAVEKLQPGDLVLAQHPETGELAYQAVLAPTVRPVGPVLRIELAGDSIRASGGHPFWVTGKGWVLARHLKPGMRLHDACGSTEIKSVTDEPEAKEITYNLIVAEFHSYFVGASKVLSHDNSIRKPTSALVPGLVER